MRFINFSLPGTLAAMACGAAFQLHAAGWEQFHGTDGHNGWAASGPDLAVYTVPRFRVGSGLGSGFTGFGNVSGPVVDEGKVFCYSNDGTVTAFRESDGARLWETMTEMSSFGSWSSPSASAGKVYMGSGEHVYCLNAESGAMLWKYRLTTMTDYGETYAMTVNAAVTIAEDIGLCYMHTYGSFGGGTRLHAIHTADGTQAWTLDMTGQGQGAVAYNPTLRWVYTTVGTEGGWAEGRGGICAVDARTGQVRWYSEGTFEPLSFGGITFDAARNRVIAAGYDFYGYSGLLVCDATTGATVWYSGDANAPAGDYTPTVGEDGRIYVCGAEFQDGPFTFCYDVAAPATNIWRTDAGDAYHGAEADAPFLWQSDYNWGNWNMSPVYAQDNGAGKRVVYVTGNSGGSSWNGMADNFGRYAMLDAETGAVLAAVDIGGGNAALDHGNLYFISDDGELVAFGPPVHVIDVACGAYGNMWPNRDQSVETGGSVTFRFGPQVADVLVDSVSVGAVSEYTFTDVTADHTIAATFRDPFASALVPSLCVTNYHANKALWGTPDYVLGKPNIADKDDTDWSAATCEMREISLVWPAWSKGTTNTAHIGMLYKDVPATELLGNGCGLMRKVSGSETNIGQIVVEFAQAVTNDTRNPYGIDLIVHGNPFFVAGGSFVYKDSNLETMMLSSFGGSGAVFGEPVTVSVAQHANGPWYTYTNVFADTAFPTQPLQWDWVAHDWTTREMDWTKPVDPLMAFGNGTSAARVISLYEGSAGGTGFDLAESGFEWIRYVKMTDPDNKQGEICGLAAVSAYLGTYHVFAEPSVGGRVEGATGTHESGASLTVTARANAGYTFDRWVTLPPGAAANGNAATFIVNRNVTVEAAFRPSRRTMLILK